MCNFSVLLSICVKACRNRCTHSLSLFAENVSRYKILTVRGQRQTSANIQAKGKTPKLLIKCFLCLFRLRTDCSQNKHFVHFRRQDVHTGYVASCSADSVGNADGKLFDLDQCAVCKCSSRYALCYSNSHEAGKHNCFICCSDHQRIMPKTCSAKHSTESVISLQNSVDDWNELLHLLEIFT